MPHFAACVRNDVVFVCEIGRGRGASEGEPYKPKMKPRSRLADLPGYDLSWPYGEDPRCRPEGAALHGVTQEPTCNGGMWGTREETPRRWHEASATKPESTAGVLVPLDLVRGGIRGICPGGWRRVRRVCGLRGRRRLGSGSRCQVRLRLFCERRWGLRFRILFRGSRQGSGNRN